MKCRWLGLCVVIVLLAVPAQAEKPFDEGSLLGTYAFTETHVREGVGVPVAYCSGYGTLTFYGNGTVYIDKYERCSDDPGQVKNEDETFFYYTLSEPFFYIMNPSDSAETQCQFLQKGAIILCDGTAREAEMFSLHLVGVKQ